MPMLHTQNDAEAGGIPEQRRSRPEPVLANTPLDVLLPQFGDIQTDPRLQNTDTRLVRQFTKTS
jgi:hypothetical protein